MFSSREKTLLEYTPNLLRKLLEEGYFRTKIILEMRTSLQQPSLASKIASLESKMTLISPISVKSYITRAKSDVNMPH